MTDPKPEPQPSPDREDAADGRPPRTDTEDPRRGAGLADPANSPEAAPDDAGA